jgi:lipoprotein-anchoring transpeptidase ErfK/SrfK
MPAQHRLLATSAVLAGVLLVFAGCGPAEYVARPISADAYPTASSSATATPTPTPTPTKPAALKAGCGQTKRQQSLELAMAAIGSYGPFVVDGVQSQEECDAIKMFKHRMGIYPSNGKADATTLDVAKRIVATKPADCHAGTALMACIDLTHQTFYVMKGGAVVLGPTVTRTGKPGFATPAGTYKIFKRELKEWSDPYEVWMPYWQQFHDGMGLHQTTTYIHDMAIGSHGCVNLLGSDARAAYALLHMGSTVRSYGRRPGT